MNEVIESVYQKRRNSVKFKKIQAVSKFKLKLRNLSGRGLIIDFFMPDWFLEPPKINLLPFLETEIKANFFQVQKTTFQIIRHLKTLGEFI